MQSFKLLSLYVYIYDYVEWSSKVYIFDDTILNSSMIVLPYLGTMSSVGPVTWSMEAWGAFQKHIWALKFKST